MTSPQTRSANELDSENVYKELEFGEPGRCFSSKMAAKRKISITTLFTEKKAKKNDNTTRE